WGLFGAGIGSMARGGGISGSIGGMDWAGTDATPAATKKNSRRQKPADQSKLGAAKENGAGKVSDTGKESDPAKAAETLTAQSVGRSTALAADWTDIAATLDGDGQAYARLVRRYQDQITAQMWRLSRQRNDCEQLVHEVFVEAYMSLRQFKGRAPFLHWLRKIATRVGYRYWKQQARARRQAAVPLQDWHRSVPAAEVGAAEETAALVHGLLKKLPPRDRLVLTLIYLEECSVAEAAELSGWSQTMVKVQAHRARKKLKKLLEEANPDEANPDEANPDEANPS
ncbi:MAG TPA: RNA polymerase sigma factor, partial [Pirellulales bacterium]|nr:RNA polymerase sigma factor [Pirellulales bacterium]